MSEERVINAKKNILCGYLSKLVTIILEFVSRTFFIKILGEELLGVNGVFVNIIQILSIAELGINNIIGYSLYEPLAKNNVEKITKLIKFYKKIYNIIALFVFVIGICIIPFLKYLIKIDIKINDIKLIYLLFLLDTVISYLFIYKGSLLKADQKNYVLIKYEIICNSIRIVLQIWALLVFKNFILYLLIKVFMTFMMNLVISKKAEKDYPYIKKNNISLNKNEQLEISKIIKAGFIYKISGILLNSTDNILISMLVGTIWVGYLSNYNIIIVTLASIYTILFGALTSSVGNIIFTEKIEIRNEVFEIMLFVSSWLAIVLSICFFSLSDDFIRLWIGKEFILSKMIVLSKALMLGISCSLQPLFCFREAVGLYTKTKYVMLLSAIINILLSIMLGKKYGVSGILFASIISMLLTYMWYEPYILYKDYLKKNCIKYFKNKIFDYIYIFFGFFIFNKFSEYFKINSWIEWIIKAIFIFILTNIFCIIYYKNSIELKKILAKCKRRKK